ncbi:helix-turn-helix transcriptional regulator [Leptospira alstonii]|nr:helix-turn-helix domain-containing protein [Leptospira alstonii]
MNDIEIRKRIKIMLDYLRESRGLNQGQIAKALKVTPGTITRLLNGQNALTSSMALLIEYVFGFSSKWLTKGEGEMLIAPSHLERKEDFDFLQSIYNRKGMKKLIENLFRLSDRDLTAIQAMAEKLDS